MNDRLPLYPRSIWLKADEHGFKNDPFSAEAVRAEADILLEGSFVSFDYYHSLKGNLSEPGPRFIFGKRGGGKTALRLQLYNDFQETLKKNENRILAIEYTDFDSVLERADYDASMVRPRYHVEEIVSLIVQRLFLLMINDEYPFNFSLLAEGEKRLFIWYAQKFGVFHEWQLDAFNGRLEGNLNRIVTSEKALMVGRGMLQIAADLTSPVASRMATLFNEMLNVESRNIKIEPEQVSLVDLLNGIVKICQSLGVDAIYILIDDVDEPQYYGEKKDFKPAFELIRSLAASPKILGIAGMIFKFFLPSEIRPECLSSLRLDKFSEQVIFWTYKNLNDILEKRLVAASDGAIHSLQHLCSADFNTKIDEWITDFAKEKGSPRALIYVGNELLAEHFRDQRSAQDKITLATWERARQRAEEVLR